MKNPLAIALVMAAVMLISLPPVTSHLHTRQVSRLLEHKYANPNQANTSVYLEPPISNYYSLGCWIAGMVVLAAVVRFSLVRREESVKGAN
jgi:hypothetical protein